MQVMEELGVRSLGREDPLEAGMATQSSILAWRIPWTEKPGGLQSMGHKELYTTELLSTRLNYHLLTINCYPCSRCWVKLVRHIP